jgi:hypothetical protein
MSLVLDIAVESRRVKPLSKLKAGGYVSKKGIMARGYSEGGMINSDSSFEEGQVLPTSDIFSEGVYAQVNIDRSVDSENVVESDKVITAPIAFSSAPGKTAYLAYITPEEAASLRQAKQGFSSEGNGLEVSDGQYQHLGPKGLMSFNGQGGGGGDLRPRRRAWRWHERIRGRLRTRRGRRRKADRSL